MTASHKIPQSRGRQLNPELGNGRSDILHKSDWLTISRMRWERGFPNPRLPQRGNQNRPSPPETPLWDGAARHTGIRKSPLRFALRGSQATGGVGAIRGSNPELGNGGSDILHKSDWLTISRMRWERGFPNPRLPQRGNQNRPSPPETPLWDGAARHTGIRKSPLRFALRGSQATGGVGAIRGSNPELGNGGSDILHKSDWLTISRMRWEQRWNGATGKMD